METKVVLPSGLLIWLEGKMLTNQHFSPTNQQISVLPWLLRSSETLISNH